MTGKSLVLDANILIPAVLGERVRGIIEAHAGKISFIVPETAYVEAGEHLVTLVVKGGRDPAGGVIFAGFHDNARNDCQPRTLRGF